MSLRREGYVERLWNNLLTSQALVFNLFGPFKQNLGLATAVMRRLVPDLVGEITDVRFGDDGSDLAIGDFVSDEGDQGRVEQVDAALSDAAGDHAAETAGAAVRVDVAAAGVTVLLPPKALAQPGNGSKARILRFGALNQAALTGWRAVEAVELGVMSPRVPQVMTVLGWRYDRWEERLWYSGRVWWASR